MSEHARLPEGWTAFSSQADSTHTTHWYATSPYPVEALKANNGEAAEPLCHTVTAATWAELHAEVTAQIELYEVLTGEEDG
ncbi:hypothetical protein ACFVT5_06045 [Streptomyces sp. NPDC058001]|uniref:hypothetical protein n=1 Tax=Streptomyces sp. NPDC058001 TaxID=3346300 RepID=UPI0036EA0DE6